MPLSRRAWGMPKINAATGAARIFYAPAKLNLSLRVVGRRADGMHLLRGTMIPIDLCDRISIRPSPRARVRREWSHPRVAAGDDLAARAARLLRRAALGRQGAALAVQKNIPIGGGLGGGSSDAATTLAALNVLWGIGFSAARLAKIGAALGADVPFFLRAWRGGGAAYASGIGEVLRAAPAPARREFLLLCPRRPTSTAAVFALFARGRAGEKSAIISPARRRAVIDLAARNDLAAAAVACNPHIAAAAERLRAAGFAPRLSGAGGAVFAAFAERTARDAAAARLRATANGECEIFCARYATGANVKKNGGDENTFGE